MKLGVVGLPNVGKSTLFNAITNAGAEAANYPFCTIEPNIGVVAVPDERLDELAEMYHPKKTTPAVDRVCRHRRSGQGREPAARAWATSSSPTSARWTRSCTSCAASRMTNIIHVDGQHRPAARHRDDQPRADPRRPRDGRSARIDKAAKMVKSGEKRYAARGATVPTSCWRIWTRASPRAPARLHRRGACNCSTSWFLLTHQAGHLRRQHRAKTTSASDDGQNPRLSRRCKAIAAAEGARGAGHLREGRGGDRRSWSRRGEARCSSRSWASSRAGLDRLDRAHAITCWG